MPCGFALPADSRRSGAKTPQPTSIEDAIEQNAKGPKRVQVANQSVEQQSIDEQIQADQYLVAKNAAAEPHFGQISIGQF